MVTLYQIPVSHYCEKIRWALTHKRIPHKQKNLLPGFHVKPMVKLSGQNSVPVIKDSGEVVAGSSQIIDYLDATYPRFSLTPSDEALAAECREWESLADEDIGPHVRRLYYSVVLDSPETIKEVFSYRGPWYTPIVINKLVEGVRPRLKAYYKIEPDTVAESHRELSAAVEKVAQALENKTFLVGDTFSRADLAVAALLAPLFRPSQYDFDWPSSLPKEYLDIAKDFERIKPWVMNIYQHHR